MMVKKKKPALPVTEPSEPEAAEPEVEPAPEQPATPFTFDPALIEQAEKFGIPVKQLILWAQSVEAKLDIAEKNFETIQQSFQQLEPLIKLSSQIANAQQQPQPAAANTPVGGANIASLLQFLPAFLGGGSTGNEELQKLAMNALSSQINMSNAITNAVVSKITAKATDDVARAAVNG